MSKLIIIRGNSGSGKTTLQHKIGRNTMLISQDIIRREMLWVEDKPDNEAVDLMMNLLVYGAKHCNTVILEGILYSDIYKRLFETAVYVYKKEIYAYYYDISFEETLTRHATKSNKFSFGETQMRRWWREKDFIGFIKENRITSDYSIEKAVEKIYADILKKCDE